MLRAGAARRHLREAVAEVDRLVLLGDVLELRHGRLRDALAVALPALSAVADALPAGAEVVIVGGNHDHYLFVPWLERRARNGEPPPLGLETAVSWAREDPLGAVAEAMGPVAVRAAYPGVWLREDVYAFHGHYCDRHTTVPMLERLGAALTARAAGEPPEGPRCAEDYERVLAPMYAWIDALAQYGGVAFAGRSGSPSTAVWTTLRPRGRRRGVRALMLQVGFVVAVAALNGSGLGPVRADLSGGTLRRAALAAVGEVASRLAPGCEHVIFGHTHRAGPLPGDDAGEWVAPGHVRLHNSGCWVDDPSFLGSEPATSPYRAGFAVVVGADGPPEIVNLLGGVTAPVPG